MKLRPYQEDLINKIKQSLMKGNKSVCTVLGCGGGKSVIQAMICKYANDKGSRVLFLVHRKELCDQIEDTFRVCGVNFDLTHIGMVQTVVRRLDKFPEFNLVITDETHHSLSKTYIKIYDYYKNAIRLGFTATPIRLGQGGLGTVYADLVEGVSTEWLIENKHLAPYKYYAVKLADTSKLKTKLGDYDIVEINELMEHTEIYAKTLDNWEKFAKDKKTIIYCSSISASKSTIEEFKNKGYKAEHIDGATDKNTRSDIMDKFRSGEITVVSNVDLFGEGISVDDCECVVLLRPTQSLGLFIQQSMRSMRYQENKTAIILDLVNNIKLHGLPDMKREWTLEQKKKNKDKKEAPIKICESCFGVCSINNKECPYCGEVFSVNATSEGEKTEGDLIEIKKEMFKNATYNSHLDIKTFEDMCIFQKAKGYKFGWTIRKCYDQKISIPAKYKYQAAKFYGIHI